MERPLDFIRTPDYELFRPRGTGTFAQWTERLLAALAWAVQAGVPRLLADVRRIHLQGEGSTFERLQLGERGAALGSSSGITVAMLAHESFLDPERFGETVAVNRGLRTRVFTDEVAALHWLVGPNAIRPVLETTRTPLRWLIP